MNTVDRSEAIQPKCAIRVPASEGYRLWSRTYDSCKNPLLALEFRTLSHKLDLLAGMDFLDVACGTGRWMINASTRGARVFGADLSFEMLRVAAEKESIKGCLVRADGRRLPFSDHCADMAICSFSVGYMCNPDRLISELGRVVRHGGTILISDLHPRAHQMGWRRSFRSGADVYEIKSSAHSAGRLIHSGQAAGLRLKEIFEPRISEPERRLMQEAGKAELFDEVSAIPAVLIVEWERP
ncbi:MAG TPA: methyltransferase domain-containing protein [Acidobacteriota bacterium]|nr:methyltransferase domain-containing protein [Acidobacteriota bacterium]